MITQRTRCLDHASISHCWLQGAYPAETISKLKRLANYYGYSLAIAMSGEPDKLSQQFQINEHFSQTIIFDGLAKIQITKLDSLHEVKNRK